MIPLYVPPYLGGELKNIEQAVRSGKLSGGEYTKACEGWLQKNAVVPRALLTTSCTHALEMAALLCGIRPGDEVIMPSFTFPSTANAFVLRGARIVFVDIRPDTMNMDETLLEAAVTDRTRAVVPVHYAGVACEMDAVLLFANAHRLMVIEDAAQGVCAAYKGKALGSLGDFGCYSFHQTKNFSMGEGGALLVNRPDAVERAEVIREKGTDKERFLKGEIDRYTWVDVGSSYLPSELNAACLQAQLQSAEKITRARLRLWNRYHAGLKILEDAGHIERPVVPAHCVQNAHIYYIKVKDRGVRARLMEFLKEQGIRTAFHYIPLHSAPAGRRFGRFCGRDIHTTKESERLLRLPLYYGLLPAQVDSVMEKTEAFFAL